MTDKYAVIGHPIKHSKSPLIHKQFAIETAQDIDYTAIEVPLDNFNTSLNQLRNITKLKGINITVPFKEQAWQLATHKSERAERAGAINTLKFDDTGTMYGDNTDGIGLCRDLSHNGVELTGKRILLLGAGGAARGVIQPIMELEPAALFIANRTASKATDLATLFSDLGDINGGGFDDIPSEYDLIINATAASLKGEVPPIPASVLAENCCCYDMMYADSDTAFVAWSKKQHASKTIDGLGMLVEQAAESFYIWRGVRPNTQSVITAIRDKKI